MMRPFNLRVPAVLALILVSCFPSTAQQDCFDAIYVCGSSYTQNTAYSGVGAEQEVAPATTCLGNGEVNSVWYRFTVYASGTLTFQLNPLNGNDDYDFALYNLSGDSCSSIMNGSLAPISCNYSSTVGPTGLSNGGSGNSNGSGGPNQNAPINVTVGQSYALLVSNFTASQNGYTLDFGGSASVADSEQAVPDSISLGITCNPRQVTLFFTEEFNCSSISGTSEITVTGPDNVVVTNVTGLGCNGGTTNSLRIRFQNKIMVTGTYTITINTGSDGNTFIDGCNNEVSPGTTFTFNVDFIGPDVDIINVIHTECGEDDGSAEAVVTNGTSPFSYSWNSSPSQNTAIATNLGPGTYRVTVTDDNGCKDRANVTIQNNSPFNLTNNSVTPVSCFGLSDGSAQVIPTGGVIPYVITWPTNPPQTGQTATGLPAGPITVTLVDATGCTAEINLVIDEPPAIVVDITAIKPDCGYANGTLTATVTGGTGAFSYAWDTNPVQNTAVASGVSAGVYHLTVTDQSGCSKTVEYVLTNAIAPDVNITDRIPDCGQGSGQATVVPTLGGQNYTYSWNTNPPQTTATATGLDFGEYFVTITDENDCVQIRNVKIDSVPAPDLSLALTPASCGASDGEITASVTDGIQPLTYAWSSSSNTGNVETGLSEGTYTVTVTDSIGCADSETVELTQEAPESEFNSTDVCDGDEMNFSSQSTANPTSWYWDFGDGSTSTDEFPVHTYSQPGQYEVTVYMIGGCLDDTVIQTVNVFAPPTAEFTVAPDIITTRTDASFTYTGSGGTTFEWDFGDEETGTGSPANHEFGEDGFYTVTLYAMDQNGCEDSSSTTIEVLLQPVVYFPNAFVPEGTTENSTFKAYGLGITALELSIYDRWGTELYYSASSREIMAVGWDGKYKGKGVKPGAYAYKVKASFYNNTSFQKLGTVTLIR